MTSVSRGIDRIDVTFDDPNLVANAGLLLVCLLYTSRSMTSRSSPGPAPNDHARRSASASTRSSWRTWPKEKARRNVPRVEGAITRWGSTDWVAPDLSTSAWSMWLPPATMACTSVSTLRPGSAPPTRPVRPTTVSYTHLDVYKRQMTVRALKIASAR